MRTAVEKEYAVVVSRSGVRFSDGEELLDKLNTWCKVTVLASAIADWERAEDGRSQSIARE
jgi:hypothetical protein